MHSLGKRADLYRSREFESPPLRIPSRKIPFLKYFSQSNRNLVPLIAVLALFGSYGTLAIVALLAIPLGLLFPEGPFVAVVLASLALAGFTSAALVVLARRQQGNMARIAAYGAAFFQLTAFVFQVLILHGKYAIPFLAIADTTTFFALGLAIGRPWLAFAFAVPALGFTAAHVASSLRQMEFELHTVGHLTAMFDPCAGDLAVFGSAFETVVSGLFALGVANIASYIGLSTDPPALWQAVLGLPVLVLTAAAGLPTTNLRSSVLSVLLVGAPVAFFAYIAARMRVRGAVVGVVVLPPLLWIVAAALAVTLGAHAGWAGWIDQQISQPCL